MADRKQPFQNIEELQRFMLHGVCPTGTELGRGSFGCVKELKMNGKLYAGKQIHEELLNPDNKDVHVITRKYLLECKVMAELQHPHIVKFLGLCYLEGSKLPVLVMERLDRSLHELLETTPNLPLTLKHQLLIDVSQGLLYLHTRNPCIVHRDLSAQNVLLTSKPVAKISDLGNARFVDLQPGQLAKTLTAVPGAWVYMPPEAFGEHVRYSKPLDIFSFGHLALFTLTQVFPGDLLTSTYTKDSGSLVARSEVERREKYIQLLRKQLKEKYPLLLLVCQCLHNIADKRPSAKEVAQQLEVVRQICSQETEEECEIEHLQHELQEVQDANERLQAELRTKNAEVDELQQKLKMHRLNEITWTKIIDMPKKLSRPNSVVIDGCVYIRGAYHIWYDSGIHKFHLQSEQWTKLPHYQFYNSTMAEVKGELTLVGGMTNFISKEASNALAVYRQYKWKQFYPPMKTCRADPAVSTHKQYLVVAGGNDGSDLTAVEILDTDNNQWLSTTELPMSCCQMSSAIIENTMYLLGGTLGKQVLSVSLQAFAQTHDVNLQWCSLPDAPLEDSVTITLHRKLLAVGGRHNKRFSSAIYFYDQKKEKWTKVGDLPFEQAICVCCVLQNTENCEILVAGGRDCDGNWCKQMHKAIVKD